jgi:hypothetical protein
MGVHSRVFPTEAAAGLFHACIPVINEQDGGTQPSSASFGGGRWPKSFEAGGGLYGGVKAMGHAIEDWKKTECPRMDNGAVCRFLPLLPGIQRTHALHPRRHRLTFDAADPLVPYQVYADEPRHGPYKRPAFKIGIAPSILRKMSVLQASTIPSR